MPLTSDIVMAVPLLSVLALATTTDLLDRRIPNGLSIGGAVVALIVNATLLGSAGVASSVLGWIVCLACLMPLYVYGGMAAGDVKLMAMVGAFLGPVHGVLACLYALVAGAALASLFLIWLSVAHWFHRELEADLVLAARDGARSKKTLEKIPYAAAVALGATAAIVQPGWLRALTSAGGLP